MDPIFAEAARQLWADSGLQVMEADFTTLQPEARYNLIVSNPPYVRHHHIEAAAKERLRWLVRYASWMSCFLPRRRYYQNKLRSK